MPKSKDSAVSGVSKSIKSRQKKFKGLWFYRKSHFATKTDRNFSDAVPTILGVFKNNVSHHKNQNGYPSGLPKKKNARVTSNAEARARAQGE
jgi:hypothetical protein